jgi:hypothetical protein
MPETNVVLMEPSGEAPGLASASFVGAEPLRMEAAPAELGEPYGPVLLYVPPHWTGWLVGKWDGEAWYQVATGIIVTPTAWRPLPKTPSWS